MPTKTAWFADDVVTALSSVPGSPEREHVTMLMRRASRIRLDGGVARAAAATVRSAAASIETHLRRVPSVEDIPLWIEAPHLERLQAFEETGPGIVAFHGMPEMMGVLLASDPGAPSHVASFLAWRGTNGKIHHAYALLHWDLERMAVAAAAATGREQGAVERLMALADAAVPPGFESEMEIWQNIPPDDADAIAAAIRRTCRDVLGEHLFLLSALLLLGSSAVELEIEPQEVDLECVPAPAWSARMAEGSLEPSRRRPGFRLPFFGGPLAWSSPRS